MNVHVKEASELHIQLDQLKEKLEVAEKKMKHLEGYYTHRLQQQQCELDNYRWVILAQSRVNSVLIISR